MSEMRIGGSGSGSLSRRLSGAGRSQATASRFHPFKGGLTLERGGNRGSASRSETSFRLPLRYLVMDVTIREIA